MEENPCFIGIPEENDAPNAISKSYYPDFSRRLVCVQYPGVVNNVDRMLETIGGIPALETVCRLNNTVFCF